MNEWITDKKDGRLIKISKIKRSSMPMNKVFIDTSDLANIMLDYIKYPKQVTEQSINARQKIETKFKKLKIYNFMSQKKISGQWF